METVQVEWRAGADPHADDRAAGTEQTIEAELVLLAMGFPDPKPVGLGVELDERTNYRAGGPFATSIQGVFAAGDCRAASRWWCGASTKAAVRPAPSTSSCAVPANYHRRFLWALQRARQHWGLWSGRPW